MQGTDLKGGVVDAQDTARVTVMTPGIAVVKSVAPTSVPVGGRVTYTYLVTNTGNVPLGDVASSITDDTCAPVTYVSGDVDNDGRLDTDQDIFESGTKETWTFRCTTTITQDTINTVVVHGTPVDPDDVPLCDPAACPVDRVRRGEGGRDRAGAGAERSPDQGRAVADRRAGARSGLVGRGPAGPGHGAGGDRPSAAREGSALTGATLALDVVPK